MSHKFHWNNVNFIAVLKDISYGECTHCQQWCSSIFWFLFLCVKRGTKILGISEFCRQMCRSDLFLIISLKCCLETSSLSYRSQWLHTTKPIIIKRLIIALLCSWVNLFCSNIVAVNRSLDLVNMGHITTDTSGYTFYI